MSDLRAKDVGVLLTPKARSPSDLQRKAKREWAARNKEHVRANFKSWYERNKEALSVKRKAQRDARKTVQ